MSYSTTKAALVTLISTATKVQNVYNYENPKPDGYPCISITNFEGTAEFADTSRFRRNYTYRILVTQERINVGPSEAERIVTGLVDELVSLFDNNANYNLSNSVIFFEPPAVKFGYLQAPDVDVRSAEITLTGTTVQ